MRYPPPVQEEGFVLPLAFGAAMVLVLCGLSVQTVALQAALVTAAEGRRLEREDALASAAQRVAGRLASSHRCLLGLPLEAWPAEGCGAGAGLAALEANVEAGARVTGWRPPATADGAGLGELRLQIPAREEAPATGRRYGLRLAATAEGLRVRGVRGLGR